MLPKELRLPAQDISKVARQGKKIENDFFITRVWFDDSLPKPQFAISISIKVDKRSTVRNRIKRKIRASIIELINEGHEFRKGKYVVIIRNRELVNVENEVIKKLLRSI